MMCSPRWLYFLPGLLLVLFGIAGYGLAMPGTRLAGVTFDAHTLLVASLAVILGYQSALFGVFTKSFATSVGLLPRDPVFARLLSLTSLEKGLVAGALSCLLGLALIAAAVELWRQVGFGNLEYARTMRLVVPGMTLTTLGFQTILASFFLSILDMGRR